MTFGNEFFKKEPLSINYPYLLLSSNRPLIFGENDFRECTSAICKMPKKSLTSHHSYLEKNSMFSVSIEMTNAGHFAVMELVNLLVMRQRIKDLIFGTFKD